MTTMDEIELVKLGFNKNEAKVYLALIKLVKASAHQLIQATKFHKNIVYDNLEKLIDKGLVTFIVEGKKKIFQITHSDMLVNFFEDKEKEILEKKKEAVKISKEINKIAREFPVKQEAQIFRGVNGVKAFYNLTLEGKDYVSFGAPQQSVDIMGETFWRNYNVKRTKKKIKVRMIFNPSLKEYGKSIQDKYTIIKYFERDFEPSSETHVQGDFVGIIVWTREPLVFLIKDKDTASSYLRFFEKMWARARN